MAPDVRVCLHRLLGSVALLALAGCGADADLSIAHLGQCDGGSGPQVRGVVQMPNGRLASAATVWERLAAAAVAPVDALTGDVRPVRGVSVQLVELRPENLADHTEPGVLESTTTNGQGEFCIGLRGGTDVSVCRYLLRVGSSDDDTLTRAFVYSTEQAIDIDYRSEATVRLILAESPPASLCDFDPDEIAAVYNAVLAAPGTVSGANASAFNAVATTIAASDAAVRAAVAAGSERPPTAVPTHTTAPTGARTPTPTRSAATRTNTSGPSPTNTLRATRTSPPGTPSTSPTRTATRTLTSTAPAATPTSPAATNTVPPATATRSPATATLPPATPTTVPPTVPPTATMPGNTVTPTPSATPGTPAAGLGERVFTIREDSMFPGVNPRSAFFTTALVGRSASDRLTAGPLVLVAGAPGADGVASLRLKQDAYFYVNIPAGNNQLCVQLLAEGSGGSIDCDGGTAASLRREQATGNNAPPSTFVLNIGSDSGPGAAVLRLRMAIAEQAPGADCSAAATFPTPEEVYFTSATAAGLKGTKFLDRDGENFSCSTWTMTDGPGMLAVAILAYDDRAGGDTVNILRIADN